MVQYNIIFAGRGGSLVNMTPFVRSVVDSNLALAAI